MMKSSLYSRRLIATVGFCAGWFVAVVLAETHPPSFAEAEELHRLADGLHARHMDDLAIAEYVRILRDFPDYPATDAVLFRLAESYRRTGQPGLADRLYLRLLNEFPQSAFRPFAALRRGEWLESGGRMDDAEPLFAAASAPGSPPEIAAAAAYRLGRLRRTKGDRSGAESAWRAALHAAPGTLAGQWAAMDLASLLLEEPSQEPRRQEAARLLEMVSTSEDPDTAAEALYRMLRHHYDTGRHAEAVRLFDTLQRRFPDAPRTRQARLLAARSSLLSGQFERALELAHEALRHPEETEACDEWLYLLANARKRSGATEAAATTYQELLERFPASPFTSAAALEAAELALVRQAFDAALRLAEQAKKDSPVAEEATWISGRALDAMNRTDQALAAFGEIAKRPDSPRAPDALLRIAQIHLRREQWLEAAQTYRRFAERYPDHPSAAAARAAAASALARADQWEAALNEWEHLIRRYPDAPEVVEARFYRPVARMRLGQFDEARRDWEALLRSGGLNAAREAEARYALSELQERAGSLVEAAETLAVATQKNPPPEWLYRILVRRAALLRRLGRDAEAARLLVELLGTPEEDTLSADTLEWLARTLLEAGEAASSLRAAEQLAGRSDGRAQAVGGYWVGRAQARLQRPGAAAAAYARAAAHPDIPRRERGEALFHWAKLLMAGGDHQAARERFEELAALATADETMLDLRAHALFGLAEVAELAGRWEDAARYFLGVGILFDDPALTPESLRRAAECYRRLGAEDRARQILRERAERYPHAPAAD